MSGFHAKARVKPQRLPRLISCKLLLPAVEDEGLWRTQDAVELAGGQWNTSPREQRHGGTNSGPNHADRGAKMAGHLSVATIETLNKILRTCRNMRHVLGREPTPEEIAGRPRMPRETIRKLLGVPLHSPDSE